MKKMKIKRTFGLTLLLLLVCGSSWAANISFTDPAGQWWSGSNFSITFDWSTGPLYVTAVGGDCSLNGTGGVGVSLNTDRPLVKSYSLNAGQIKNASNMAGPEIAVTDIIFFPFTMVWANGSDDYFVAWDLLSETLMLYYGDPSCYTYLGLDFSADLDWSTVGTSITFTADHVEAIVGQQCCSSVPIPGTIWLLFSGLFGLVCIRRRNSA